MAGRIDRTLEDDTFVGRTREDDKFVVDTIGLNRKTWIDESGLPTSHALHGIERFHRIDLGHMEIEHAVDDAKVHVKPWKSNTWSVSRSYAPFLSVVHSPAVCASSAHTAFLLARSGSVCMQNRNRALPDAEPGNPPIRLVDSIL